MSKIAGKITNENGKRRNIVAGKLYVHRGEVRYLEVNEGYRISIHDESNQGARLAAPTFSAGRYKDPWRYRRHGINSLRERKGKFVRVEETGVEPRELLELKWTDHLNRGNRRCVQRLEPGEWSGARDEHFRNDLIESIKVPKNATVRIFEHSPPGGARLDLPGGEEYDLRDFGMFRKLSHLVYTLDAWDEIGFEFGDILSDKPIGKPWTIQTILHGLAGSAVEGYVDFGESESESTNWHLNSSITASMEIGSDAAGYKVGLSSTTEAGGGGEKGKSGSRNAGIKVSGPIPEPPEGADPSTWIGHIRVDTVVQSHDVEQEIVRTLQNRDRPNITVAQRGTIRARLLKGESSVLPYIPGR